MRLALLITIGVLILLALGRLAAALADGRSKAPGRAFERYAGPDGRPFYRLHAGINNAYLLPCDSGWLLVDTGYPEDYARFKAALEGIGVPLSSIRYLFLTHAHDDHAGFAAELVGETGCRLIVPGAALKELGQGRMAWNGKAITQRIAVASWLYDAVKRRDLRYPPLSPRETDAILEGEVDAGTLCPGLAGRFVPTPGHSPDSYSLILDDGRAFVGDAAMNYLGALGADYRPIFVSDEEETYRSLGLLLDRGVRVLYTGHGPAFEAERLARHAHVAR